MNNLNDLDFSNRKYNGWQQVENSVDMSTTVSGTPFDLFTVTGDVKAKVVGICTTNLAGANATVEVGVTGTTAGIIATTTATDIDANDIWHDASPDSQVELATVMAENIIPNGLNIQETTKVAEISSGVIKFICLWRPLSVDGKIVAA